MVFMWIANLFLVETMTDKSRTRQFESSVRKTREKTSGPITDTDELGGLLERVRRKAEAPLRDEREWSAPSDRDAPKPEYETLLDFAQKASSELEAMEADISRLNDVEEEANREAYSSMLGITDGSNAERALESDERVVDKLRHEALESSQDETAAQNINKSVSKNIESLEENIDEIQTDLNNSLTSYAEQFENYMEEMAGRARDEYGAMAQLTDYLQDLNQMDTDSELGEMTVEYLKNETADILSTQTQRVSEIYSEMVRASESTKRLQENVETDVADRYDIDTGRLEDSLEYAEETLENMAGGYSDFAERAQEMISENVRDMDSVDISSLETWNPQTGVKSA